MIISHVCNQSVDIFAGLMQYYLKHLG